MQQLFDEYLSLFADIYVKILKDVELTPILLWDDVTINSLELRLERNSCVDRLERAIKGNEELLKLKSNYPQFAHLTNAVLENADMFSQVEADAILFPDFYEEEHKQSAISSLLVELSRLVYEDEADFIFNYLERSNLKEDTWSKCFARLYRRFPEIRPKALKKFFAFLDKTDILTIPIGKKALSIFDASKESIEDSMKILQKIYEKSTPTYSFLLEKKELDRVNFFRYCSLKDIPEEYPFVRMLYRTRYLSVVEFEAAYTAMGMEKMSKYDFGLAQRILPRLLTRLTKVSDEEAIEIVRGKSKVVSRVYAENDYWLASAALVFAEIFGIKFDAYLKRVIPYLSLYDSSSFIKDIEYGNPNNKELGIFLMRNVIYQNEDNKKVLHSLSELEDICRAWKNMPLKEIDSRKYKKILSLCNTYCFRNINSVPFSREAMYWKMSEADYVEAEKIFLDSQSVPEPFDTQKIWISGEYIGRFLPRSDVRVGFFGNYTGCCQHFTGVGKTSAISSMKDDFAQLFVIEKKGRIIAGSHVWLVNEDGQNGICFDSVEILRSYESSREVFFIYKKVCDSFSRQYDRVTIGKNPFPELDAVKPLPIPNGIRSDAQNQFSFRSKRQYD